MEELREQSESMFVIHHSTKIASYGCGRRRVEPFIQHRAQSGRSEGTSGPIESGIETHINESADLQTLARHDRDWKLGGYKRVLWNPVEAHHLEARHLHHDDAALA
jgi:hypothetical protein